MKTQRKIDESGAWPFYQAYHEEETILRHDCSKDIPLRELREKRLYRLLNKDGKEIVVYKIDEGLIKGNKTKKCDYGIYTEDDLLFLIELKGADLNQAIEQINETITILLKRPNIQVKTLKARVVMSKVRVPSILSTKEKQLKQLLQKFYGGGDFVKKSVCLEEVL